MQARRELDRRSGADRPSSGCVCDKLGAAPVEGRWNEDAPGSRGESALSGKARTGPARWPGGAHRGPAVRTPPLSSVDAIVTPDDAALLAGGEVAASVAATVGSTVAKRGSVTAAGTRGVRGGAMSRVPSSSSATSCPQSTLLPALVSHCEGSMSSKQPLLLGGGGGEAAMAAMNTAGTAAGTGTDDDRRAVGAVAPPGPWAVAARSSALLWGLAVSGARLLVGASAGGSACA